MVAGPTRKPKSGKRRDGFTGERFHLMCSTYHEHARTKTLRHSPCLRNGVTQHALERYVERWLDETGKRLEVLTTGLDADHLTTRLDAQASDHWQKYQEGLDRLMTYLYQHHPEQFHAIMQEDDRVRLAEEAAKVLPSRRHQNGELMKKYGPRLRDAMRRRTPDPLPVHRTIREFIKAYRASFDPTVVQEEIDRLETEHTALFRRYADLPTPRAKQKATEELKTLEDRIEEMEKQKEDAAAIVEKHLREMLDLQDSITKAKLALRAESGERALRQRAEALRGVIQRIECTFTATGARGGGPGKANSRLASVTIYPLVGDSAEFLVTSDHVLRRDRVVSRW